MRTAAQGAHLTSSHSGSLAPRRSNLACPAVTAALDGRATPYQQGLTIILWTTGAVGIALPLALLSSSERRGRRAHASRCAAARGEALCLCHLYLASCCAWAWAARLAGGAAH